MRALVYVKSAGPAQLAIPLVKIMKNNGDTVRVIADGPAVDLCTKADIPLYFGGPAGKIAYKSFSVDLACDIMAACHPDVFVVAPNGDPFMSEKKLIEGAQRAGVPVVFVEDFWGNSRRLDAKADLYLVLDEYAAEVARRRWKNVNVAIIGNHGATKVVPSPHAVQFVNSLREKFDTIFCFLGGGVEATGSQLRLLAESLRISAVSNWCLIPRFHPGYAKNPSPSGKTWQEVWCNELELLGGYSDFTVFADDLKTEDVVVLSDVVFGGYPTDFTKAVCAGKRAVSLFTAETKEAFAREAGLDQVPMVALDLAEQLTRPADILALLSKPLPDPAKLMPYDPMVAYSAIAKLL